MIEIYERKLGCDAPICFKFKKQVADSYEGQRKYKEAELIYKELLSTIHEKEFGKITEDNKTVWQVAEEAQENSYWPPKYPNAQLILKKLMALYIRQRKHEAARIINRALV